MGPVPTVAAIGPFGGGRFPLIFGDQAAAGPPPKKLPVAPADFALERVAGHSR